MNGPPLSQEALKMAINFLCQDIHEWAEEWGFWEDVTTIDLDAKTFAQKIALIHSELSEALEESRSGHELCTRYETPKGPVPRKPVGIAIELADTVIRVMDLCGAMGIDLGQAINEKMAYNRTRPYKHGRTY